MKSRRRTRRIVGLLPRLGWLIQAMGRWLLRHPQPFFAAACVLGAGWALWGYAQRADAFRIARVQLPPQASFHPTPPLLGMNLWRVDLRAVAGDLKRQEPWWKDVRVIRVLPNTIRVVAIPRLPAAQVRLERWHPVDGGGFILPDGSAEPAERLVRLVGFQRAGVALKAGRDNRDERLIAALRILRRIQRTQPVVGRRLTELDVGDPSRLRLVLDLPAAPGAAQAGGETEIRCGSEAELDTQLGKLRAVLRTMARQPVKARYIDVRFQDPVMAPAS